MKKIAGIFIDQRNLEVLCINALNIKNFGVTVFSDSKVLFKNILNAQIDLLIVDSCIQSETIEMIERYLMMSPKLHIIVLGNNEKQQKDFIDIGCKIYTNENNILFEIDNLTIDLPTKHTKNIEKTGKWRLSILDYNLYTPCNNKIKLTVREFKFLKLLFESKNVVTKDEIKRHVITGDYYTSDQRIALLVARLRKKVSKESTQVLPIKSDYTNGYVFAGPCCVQNQD
ncbi:MAG: winged helix-turn-helix domain-containing protein [Methylococcales bacterium]|nr:winged helix-turn-helix domain-containing protein [Methylococcales bacterium]